MIIPRGGAALHRLCREQATIPVITGGIGICHVFVDESADLARAVDIVENAKVQRPSVCNALDTVLVHRDVAAGVPARDGRAAGAEQGGAARHARRARHPAGPRPRGATVVPAGPDDFDTEWLALILGVKIVDWLDEAIAHIQEHSTEHSDSILTNDWAQRRRASWTRSTRRRCTSTPARASTTAGSSAWAPRSRSARRSSTPAARWGWRS